MKVVVWCDEPYPVYAFAERLVEERCHWISPVGSVATVREYPRSELAKARAALCSDSDRRSAARVRNHVNGSCLSTWTSSDDKVKKMLAAWFDRETGHSAADGVKVMNQVDQRLRADAAGPVETEPKP